MLVSRNDVRIEDLAMAIDVVVVVIDSVIDCVAICVDFVDGLAMVIELLV